MIVFPISLFLTTLLVALTEERLNQNRQLPAFGRAMRKEFLMNPLMSQLNHGSFGTYPRVVQQTLHEYQNRIEIHPDLWVRREVRAELNNVRELVAKLVQASADDVVMIINTTSGMNAIFRSMVFGAGERILQFSTTFGSMQSIIKYICDRSNGAVTSLTFNVTYPISQNQIVRDFEAFLEETYDPEHPIRIALIDHIVSTPAVIVPIERIIPLLRAHNITVIVDGAHAIGQIPVNITALQPDYYVGTCYKWMYAAKNCAMMYVDKRHQSSLHPAQINSAYAEPADFQNEFFWTGTMDYSAYMTVATALKFREDVGGEVAIMSYNNRLAVDGGNYLATVLGTVILQDLDQIGNMVDVLLPIRNMDDQTVTAGFWTELLLYRFPVVFAHGHKHGGRWYIRVSAQIYNDLDDFVILGTVLNTICSEINGNNSTGMSLTRHTATALAAFTAYNFFSDGKRPDGLTLITWKKGKSLVWDATCVESFARNYEAANLTARGKFKL